MSVILKDAVIHLDGDCRVEDAEILLSLLHENPARTVDLTSVGHLHAAVFQILFALRPKWIGPAADLFVHNWLTPLFVSDETQRY